MIRSVPALLLSVVHAAALAVALTDPGQHAVAGLLVLGGLTARWFLRHRRAAVPVPVSAPVSASASASAVVPGAVPDPVPARAGTPRGVDAVPAAARAA